MYMRPLISVLKLRCPVLINCHDELYFMIFSNQNLRTAILTLWQILLKKMSGRSNYALPSHKQLTTYSKVSKDFSYNKQTHDHCRRQICWFLGRMTQEEAEFVWRKSLNLKSPPTYSRQLKNIQSPVNATRYERAGRIVPVPQIPRSESK